jgi:hypothetical protein
MEEEVGEIIGVNWKGYTVCEGDIRISGGFVLSISFSTKSDPAE